VASVFVTNGGYNGVQQVLVGNNQDSDYGNSDNKPPLSLNFDVNAQKRSIFQKLAFISVWALWRPPRFRGS
jgi:hypothetical protein